MATAEELLKSQNNIETLVEEPGIFLIDGESRTITVPENESLFGVTGDKDVERKYFQCPKIVGDNIDLSQHQIYISYVFTQTQNDTIFPSVGNGLYYCDDVEVSGDNITFSWLLSGNVLSNPGFIAFKVMAKKSEGLELKTKWNTAPAFGTVLITVPDGEEIAEEYPDIINQLLTKMESVDVKNIKKINVFDKTDITSGGYFRGTVGSDINSVVSLEGAFYCNQIWDVKEGDVIRTSNPYMGISIYDENNSLIVKYNDELTTHTLPSGSKKMRYSSTVTSANYLDNAMITINFEMPEMYIPYGLDSFPTYEDLLINEKIKKIVNKKTYIILRFDGTGNIDFIEDPRYALVCKEFGYNCTISVGFSGGSMVTSAEQFRKLMKYGIDFGIYSNNNPPSLSVISGEDQESISACETYVSEATEAAKTIGAYCPVTWLCRQSNSGYALEKALKKYGYMIASGIYYGDANTGLIEDSSKFTLQTSSLTPDTVDSVISKLNNAIENGYDIAVLTHGFYETEEEALENYSCTEENYRQFLNAVKSYVDAGKAEVLTYSEYISKRKNNAVLRTKENQRIANWIFN